MVDDMVILSDRIMLVLRADKSVPARDIQSPRSGGSYIWILYLHLHVKSTNTIVLVNNIFANLVTAVFAFLV